MWSIQELGKRFNLSERQVRLRLTALDNLLQGHTTHGQFGKIVLNDAGFRLFEQLMMLEADGQGTSAAVETLRQELGITQSTSAQTDDGNPGKGTTLDVEPPSSALLAALEGRINDLQEQIRELKADKDHLWSQLEQSQSQVQAMLPAVSEGRKAMSRWEHIKAAIRGR